MLKVIAKDATKLETAVDADIEKFNRWFQQHLKNGEPLVRSEKAILKTYLFFKLKGEGDGTSSDG